MRPRRAASFGEAVAAPAPTAADQTKTVAELSADITRAAISVELRSQLLAVARAATAAAKEPGNKDAAALHQVLQMGVELATGLSSSTAFTTQTRTEIEQQLTEGLALFSDPRTRDSGKARIEELSQFRDVMTRISREPLPGKVRAALAPAFAYAQAHLDVAPKILGAIEEFAAVTAAYDAAPKRDNPIASLRNPTNEVIKQVEQLRQAFITAANEPAAALVTSPEGLLAPVADLRTETELWATLDGMQSTLETLNAYKPRPTGALDNRMQRAAVIASSATKSVNRGEAIRLLTQMQRVARLSVAVSKKSLADVPPAVAQTYAGVAVTDFETKVKTLLGELVSQLAAGTEPDKNKVARLQAVSDLSDALKMAAELEKNLATVPTLDRWIDFTITPDQAKALTAPVKDAISAGFAGFITDSPPAIDRFLKSRADYLPVLAFFARSAQYAEVCATMPQGVTGDIARLVTPLEKQPFDLERYLSYATNVSTLLTSTDPDNAKLATDFALTRLRAEMKFSPKDLMPVEKPK